MKTDADFLQEMIAEGYWGVRKLPTGDWAGVIKMLFGERLCVGLDESGYRLFYDYPNRMSAGRAIAEWNGTGDPSGPWIKKKGRVGDTYVEESGPGETP